jgi:hypothetical protein
MLKLKRWGAYALVLCLYLASLIGAIALARTKPHFDRDVPGMFFLICAAVCAVAYARWAPLLVRLNRAEPGEDIIVDKPLAVRLAEDPEYQQDLREMEEQERWSDEMNSPSRKAWKCSRCGEENPSNFDICWKCQCPNPSVNS